MNFKSILSKSSLGSSTSSKTSNQSEEIIKLQSDIESLTQNVSSLKILLESRDSAIGSLAREKEKIYIDLKKVQRSNRYLHQQLLYEREMHSKDKKYLIDSIKKLSKKSTTNDISHKQIYSEKQCLCAMRKEIYTKDEVIFTLCSKYLKIKKYKCILQNKYKILQRNCGEVCQNVLKVLKDNKKLINSFLNELAKTTVSSSQENYNINLLKINNDIQFENIQLKLHQVSKIYLGEGSNQEESIIGIGGPSFQYFWNNYESNYEETSPLRMTNTRRSTIHLKNSYKSYFNKSISDSHLHRDFYK